MKILCIFILFGSHHMTLQFTFLSKVAALFKVGNSKELPSIPEHLSDEGKDFILQCLQRNPSHRPTAAQLLEHPFVINIASSERLILDPGPITNAVRFLVLLCFCSIFCNCLSFTHFDQK